MLLFKRLLLLSLLFFGIPPADTNKKVAYYITQLERIKHIGSITVISRYDLTTFYESANGFSGFEYDLVTLFAKHLGVKVNFKIPDTFSDTLSKIRQGGFADFAAAGITITEERKHHLLFTPSYQQVTEQVIYRGGTKRPKKPEDLTKGILEVVRGTSHVESLLRLKKDIPELQWLTNPEFETDELLYLLHERLIDYTIADSNQITLLRRFYPKLHVAFNLSPASDYAWAFTKSDDLSLYNEVVLFFEKIRKNKVLHQLIDRHFGHLKQIRYVGSCVFKKHIKSRLPLYQNLFESAGKKHNIDWQLLAAISYQESHWNKRAISPTGVKGLMMLTRGTAKDLNVTNRTDPSQSIYGGARYLMQRIKKFPKRIHEPDRTWLALASYNVGFGHVNDARILTQKLGKNPDKWIDVREILPLLTKQKWYSQTKHGYARGTEPVVYVTNIRSYLDLLIWHSHHKEKHEDNTMPVIDKLQIKL
jgi:membrane-bound lytic murein transglycosylase F